MADRDLEGELVREAPSPGGQDASSKGISLQSALAVLGASLSLFCSVGFLNAFGVFQEWYKEHQLSHYSESTISWIGSVSIFLLYALSPVAGILVDRLGPTTLLIFGSIGQLLAIFMTSLCYEYYQFFLAQSLLLGISSTFLTLPPMSVVSRRLPTHRGLALGLVIGGSSLGGVIWPIMLERLLAFTNLGFGWVMRIVGFTMLPLLAFSCATVFEPSKPAVAVAVAKSPAATASSSPNASESDEAQTAMPSENEKKASFLEGLVIMKNKVFLLLCFGLALAYFGLFVPFFYVSVYSDAKGINAQSSFYLISIINGASLFGRVIPGYLADRYGHFNLCVLALGFSGVIAFCWTAATTYAGLIVWSVAYGFTSGAILSLQGACAGKIATPRTQGTALGLVFGMVAITALVGTPIGGTLVVHSGYGALAAFTGATLLAGMVLMVMSRLALSRKIFVAI